MNESYPEIPTQIPLHTYHRYQTLINYMNDYISDLSLIVADLKQIVYSMVNIKTNPYHTPPLCHNYECEVQYMMGMCRQNMEDIFRISTILKGYRKGKTFLDKLISQQSIEESLGEDSYINVSLEMNPGISRENQQKKQNTFTFQQNKIGFLTFREFQQQNKDNEGTYLSRTQLKTSYIPQYDDQKSKSKHQQANSHDSYLRSLELIDLIKQELAICDTDDS